MSPRRWFGLVLLSGLLVVSCFALFGWTRAPAPFPMRQQAFTNSLGMKLVLIPAGKFTMGSPKEENHAIDEQQHEVQITKAFYLGVHEVTQKEFREVIGYNPSYFSNVGTGREGTTYRNESKPSGGKEKVRGMDTDDFPVENVRWKEALEFCKKLTALVKEKESRRIYRLPTEAEWEYACRGASTSYQVFYFGNSMSSTQANFNGNYPYVGTEKGPYLARTCKVGSYKANDFGLYDMHGNVWQWCADWYDKDYYGKSPRKDPAGPAAKDSIRVIRGGSWDQYGRNCRSAHRWAYAPEYRGNDLGFRIAAVPLK